jgi:hypothetical protein
MSAVSAFDVHVIRDLAVEGEVVVATHGAI